MLPPLAFPGQSINNEEKNLMILTPERSVCLPRIAFQAWQWQPI